MHNGILELRDDVGHRTVVTVLMLPQEPTAVLLALLAMRCTSSPKLCRKELVEDQAKIDIRALSASLVEGQATRSCQH